MVCLIGLKILVRSKRRHKNDWCSEFWWGYFICIYFGYLFAYVCYFQTIFYWNKWAGLELKHLELKVKMLTTNAAHGAVWPDLAKFRQLSKNLETFDNIWQSCEPLFGTFCRLLGKISSLFNGQILENNLVTLPRWLLRRFYFVFISHWCEVLWARRFKDVGVWCDLFRSDNKTFNDRYLLPPCIGEDI